MAQLYREIDPISCYEEYMFTMFGAEYEELNDVILKQTKLAFIAGFHRSMAVLQKIGATKPPEEALALFSQIEKRCLDYGKQVQSEPKIVKPILVTP